jgi:hypothetical protein
MNLSIILQSTFVSHMASSIQNSQLNFCMHWADQIKENDVSRSCGTHGRGQ